MKKILIVLLVPLLFACSKDSSNDPVPYTTKYKVGHEYVQTFYRQGSGTQGEIRLLSIDDRLPYEIFPDDEVFAQIAPTDTSRPDVSESREIKLYQVANLRFKFKATDWSKWQSIYDAKRITDWRWVLGKTEEYTFEVKIYERIIIVSEVQ